MAHAHDPQVHIVHPPARLSYAQLRAVRAVLPPTASKSAIDQVVIPAATNESGVFPKVFQEREAPYAARI